MCALVKNDKDLLACIRNNAIGIYHLADRVALVHLKRKGDLICDINKYYYPEEKNGKVVLHRKAEDICNNIEYIKEKSNSKGTPEKESKEKESKENKQNSQEKKSQHTLVSKNNSNPNSEWYCVDIEYRQSKKVQTEVCSTFEGRFDIIAVSKKAPHRIAVIELKYNSSAISGSAGIVKHIKDFKTFSQKPECIENLASEIVCQLHNLQQIGVDVPESLLKTSYDFTDKIEFYVITLWDDKSNPKETMGRYLFSDLRENWVGKNSPRVAKYNAMTETGIDVENNTFFDIKFLFKDVTSPTDFDIDDILKETLYKYVL